MQSQFENHPTNADLANLQQYDDVIFNLEYFNSDPSNKIVHNILQDHNRCLEPYQSYQVIDKHGKTSSRQFNLRKWLEHYPGFTNLYLHHAEILRQILK